MRGRFRKLLKAALVVPVDPAWAPQALGAGTIVELIDERPDAPPRALASDVLIRFQDAAARQPLGWLWERTPLKQAGGPLRRQAWETDEYLSSVDWARDLMAQPGQDARTWLCVEGPKQLDLLKRVVRELGGRVEARDGKLTVVRRAIRLILNQEVSVEEVQETQRAARGRKTSAKHRVKAKVNRRVEGNGKAERAPRRSAGQSVGEKLVALMKGNGLARSLAGGKELSKKQLVQLRDEINERAAKAREAGQGKLASQLSSANRLVRRLARA